MFHHSVSLVPPIYFSSPTARLRRLPLTRPIRPHRYLRVRNTICARNHGVGGAKLKRLRRWLPSRGPARTDVFET
ncbi:unnamed protein product, partial [Trichogramma brassicae]